MGASSRIYVLGVHDLPATRVGRVMMMVPDVDQVVHRTPKLFVGRGGVKVYGSIPLTRIQCNTNFVYAS